MEWDHEVTRRVSQVPKGDVIHVEDTCLNKAKNALVCAGAIERYVSKIP